MKIKEIKEKDQEALQEQLVKNRKQLFELRSQAVTEKLENPSQLQKLRRDIARIKTVQRQRELEQVKNAK